MIADYKFKLATARISLQLCLLGLLVGALASGLIVLFQLTVAALQHLVLIQSADFTELPLWMRASLPILGALIIYLLVSRTKTAYRRMGIAYVIHRVKCHYGRISLTSGIGQFVHAVVALVCGFSVGKEGPAVHIGATAATMMSKRWALPDNTMRILSSCGIAAGIAAIFNTPLAGVIFVLEVVLRDYKIHYFLPIMLAAITGAIIYRAVFGDIHVYSHLELVRLPLDQYPTLIMFGLVLGIVAALFNHALLQVTQRASTLNLATRFGIAGLATAAIVAVVPGAMGGEHSAVALAHSADATILGLLILLTAKILATIAAIGFGIPGGLIGPLYGMGALLGAMVALILSPMLPQLQEYQGIYAAIGMTAMMGVCLNAPMASLLALVELTDDASLILPYLLVTLPGFLLAHEGLGARAIFLRQLDIMGLEYRVPPLEQALQKTGVLALMDRNIILARPGLADEELMELLKSAEHHRLLRATDEGQEMITLHANFTDESNSALKREVIPGLPDRSTLAEVYRLLEPKRGGAVYVYMEQPDTPVGLITWPMLYRFFRDGEV